MVDTRKTGKNPKKVKNSILLLEIENDIFHENAPKQDKRDARKISSPEKRQNSGMLRGLGCFLGRNWAVVVPPI